jgi:anti-sigma factor RsiW
MSDRTDSHPDDALLQGLLDGELDMGAQAGLEDHLERCDDCARILASLRATIAGLESLPEVPLGRDLSRDVLAALRVHPARNPRSRSLAWAGVAEGISAIAILAWAWPRAERALAAVPRVPWQELLDAVGSILSRGPRVAWLSLDSLVGPIIGLRRAVEHLPLGAGQVGALLLFATVAWLVGNAVVLRRLPVNGQGDGLA